ncbi:MAG: hypothetical protein VX498_01055, partial [Myxococcota bacterium]|nr:hypothetical protein [Myxococcota bacterium]
LQLLLLLEDSTLHALVVDEGLVGGLEIFLLLGSVAVVVATAPLWERRLPTPVLRAIDVLESLPIVVGGITCAAVVAVGAAIQRPLFWGGIVVAVLVARGLGLQVPTGGDGSWRAPSNRLRRTGLAVFCAAATYYGSTSLWEGATYKNPVFRLRDLWLDGPGSSSLGSGLPWLILGGLAGGGLLFLSTRGPRSDRSRALLGTATAVALLSLVLIWTTAPSSHRALADIVSSLGALVFAAGLGCFATVRALPPQLGLAIADPRWLLARGLPLVLWGGFCVVRGLSVSMWTPPAELPPGVEQIAEPRSIFSLATGADGESIFYTERGRTELGLIGPDGHRSWDLQRSAAEHVEELGGPDSTGTLWAAIQAYALEAQLVMLAIEDTAGPRSVSVEALGQERAEAVGLVDEEGTRVYETEADRLYPDRVSHVALEGCWLASWTPVPGSKDGDVLLGCENGGRGLLFRGSERRIVEEVPLNSRLEGGAFSPSGDRLFGVSLWSDPYLHAFNWPTGEERARRIIGPFNWEVLAVPEAEGYRLWVPRFIEGVVLVLNPDTLEIEARVPLSFGIRAMHYEPVHKRIWAAAAYSGRLWSIEAEPPYRATPVALCGLTRDLTSDTAGRVVASTDCGVFRVDAGLLFADQ